MQRVLAAAVLAAAFAAGSGVSPVFADDADRAIDEALAAFRKAYASREESARISAVETLGAVQHKRVVEALASPLRSDPSAAVKRAAAGALGGQWAPSAVATLVKALDPDRAPKDVTAAIIAALGRTEADEAVPALVSLLGVRNRFAANDESTFTSAALDALAKIGSSRSLEDVMTFLSKETNLAHHAARAKLGKEPLLKDAMATLAAITGEKHAHPNEWRVWYLRAKGTLREIRVYRCDRSGRTFDRPDGKTRCPQDGDERASCGTFLKTRFENGGLAAAR